jgi:hypothetical protein
MEKDELPAPLPQAVFTVALSSSWRGSVARDGGG